MNLKLKDVEVNKIERFYYTNCRYCDSFDKCKRSKFRKINECINKRE